MDDQYDQRIQEDDSVEVKWDSDNSKKRRYAAKRGTHFFFFFISSSYTGKVADKTRVIWTLVLA